jgi:hypothetical protein
MSPSRVEVKIRCLPSGDAVVSALYAPVLVSCRRSEPSGRAEYISNCPSGQTYPRDGSGTAGQAVSFAKVEL